MIDALFAAWAFGALWFAALGWRDRFQTPPSGLTLSGVLWRAALWPAVILWAVALVLLADDEPEGWGDE